MARTLHAKLAALFFAAIGAISLVYAALSLTTTRLYFEEVNQRLNRTLAANIVKETPILSDGAVDFAALDHLFHTLMAINPAIEVYLLDAGGRILAYNAPPGQVKRTRVDIAPIRTFLAGGEAFPIRGSDPRSPTRGKVFSAAPLPGADRPAFYLYIVLGGERYDSVAHMIRESYALRLALAIAAASLCLGLVSGLLSLRFLTRRLRRLGAAVHAFEAGGFAAPIALGDWRRDGTGDEIAQLGAAAEQMSRRIVDQIAQLRRGDAARRELVANISHDLRTPLTSLRGYLETLAMKEGTLPEPVRRHYLELAAKHASRLSRLTDELFELARLEGAGVELRREPFCLAELAQDVAQKFKLEADNRDIRLETIIPAAAPFVSGDIALIERVLENLLDNAIKYTPDGGTVRLALRPGQERVAASVSDTGIGIRENAIPHIFERFYRVEASRGAGPDGTGLGLAIVRRILELHGCAVDVESRPGRGTSFTFALPIAA